jgi:hypothetical protein
MLPAFGMSQPTDQECGRRVPRMDRRAARLGSLLAACAALASARCTFPEYNYGNAPGPGAAGTGGGSAGAGAVSGGGSGASSGGGKGGTDAPGTGGLAGAEPEIGGAPECAPEQWPVEHCASGCLRRYPDHCYDGELSGDERAVDCGGSCQRCTREACTSNTDCLSGQCVANAAGESSCFAPLTISLTHHELNKVVGSTAWSMTLFNEQPEGGQAYNFKQLKLRYYFNRTGIVEPLLVRATQSNLRLANGQSQALKQTSWSVQRFEDAADTVFNAYVEVGFAEAGQLFPGDSVDLYQQMLTGDPASSSFDQRANYSFTEVNEDPSLHLAIFYRDQLIWGLEPRPADPRACFARAVNLNGPALVINGNSWQSAQDAAITTTGSGVSQGGTPFPAVSGTAATLLQTVTRLDAGKELNLLADNGSYLVYLYATSPTNDAAPSTFTVQGVEPDLGSKFRSQPVDGGQVWARLGPYRVDVAKGKVTVGVTSGTITFAGLELWYPQ